jgi:hypothetical protein
LKTHPEEETKEELRIKTRDTKVQTRMKRDKVVEHRGKHKPGTKPKSDSTTEKKKRTKKKKVKKIKKKSTTSTKTDL